MNSIFTDSSRTVQTAFLQTFPTPVKYPFSAEAQEIAGRLSAKALSDGTHRASPSSSLPIIFDKANTAAPARHPKNALYASAARTTVTSSPLADTPSRSALDAASAHLLVTARLTPAQAIITQKEYTLVTRVNSPIHSAPTFSATYALKLTDTALTATETAESITAFNKNFLVEPIYCILTAEKSPIIRIY